MKSKTKTNLLVGAKVVIDWPVRWKGATEKYVQGLRADAEKNEAYFGETGTIVAYNHGAENGKELEILLDGAVREADKGEIANLYIGAVTVTELPKDSNADVLAALERIESLLRARWGVMD